MNTTLKEKGILLPSIGDVIEFRDIGDLDDGPKLGKVVAVDMDYVTVQVPGSPAIEIPVKNIMTTYRESLEKTLKDIYEIVDYATIEELEFFESVLREAATYSRLIKTLLLMKQDNAYANVDVKSLAPAGEILDDKSGEPMSVRILLSNIASNPDINKAGLVKVDRTTKKPEWFLPKKAGELLGFLVSKADPKVWARILQQNPKADMNTLLSLAYAEN